MMDKFYPIVVIEIAEADGGGYMAYMPDLKGCMSHGDTPDEAMASVREAGQEWIDEANAQGLPIPQPGSAAHSARQEREALFETIKRQSQAIEKMTCDIQNFERDIATLSTTLDAVMARLNTESPYVTFIGTEKVSDFEVVH